MAFPLTGLKMKVAAHNDKQVSLLKSTYLVATWPFFHMRKWANNTTLLLK